MTQAAPSAAIPWDGLLEVLSSYASRGQLYGAVAAVGDDAWTAADVRRRARRILFQEALPAFARWPARPAEWWDALPPRVEATRELAAAPSGRVDWPGTRLRGWPPHDGFWTRTRRRLDDEMLVDVLAWTLRRADAVRADATSLVPGLDAPAADRLDAAAHILPLLPAGAGGERPDRAALAAAAASGRPWRSLAEAARVLLAEDAGLESVARRLLLPDEAARGRLFQLGCAGAVLRAARRTGASVVSLRPLGVGAGPAYRVVDTGGRAWDLWVEAAGMWAHYGRPSPYASATRHLPGVSQPLGADLVLALPGKHALIVECKYSLDPAYVTRNGYEQALAYQAEALAGLFETASAAVVGPDGVVSGRGIATTPLGRVEIVSAAGLAAAVTQALQL